MGWVTMLPKCAAVNVPEELLAEDGAEPPAEVSDSLTSNFAFHLCPAPRMIGASHTCRLSCSQGRFDKPTSKSLHSSTSLDCVSPTCRYRLAC